MKKKKKLIGEGGDDAAVRRAQLCRSVGQHIKRTVPLIQKCEKT